MGILRVVLALAVVSVHLGIKFPFIGMPAYRGEAHYAVSGFFILSGFYMDLVLNEKYLARPQGIRQFYRARFWRLAPAFYAVFVLSVLLALYSGTTTFGQWSRPTGEVLDRIAAMPLLWQGIVAVANGTSFLTDALLFVWFAPDGAVHLAAGNDAPAPMIAGNQLTLMPQTWSLSIELVFYALVPLLARRRWFWLALLIVAGYALRYWLFHINGISRGSYAWSYAFMPAELHFFFIGMLGHRFYQFALKGAAWPKPIGFAALGVYLVWFMVWKESAVGANAMAHTLLLGLMMPFVFAAFGNLKWDRAIGELSYAVFICHIAAFKLLTLYYGDMRPPTIIVYAAVIALSLLIYVAIERPTERYRASVAPKLKIA